MRKVLIVEDEAALGTLLACYLSDEGYDTRVATDAEQAIRTGEQFHPQVVVLDWMLKSEMCGGQVIDALVRTPNPPWIILVSGYPIEELRQQAVLDRATSFLPKPFDPPELLQTVQRCFAMHESQGEGS
jgi:two-component system nitrogen regulation response regulator NtrX